VMDSGLFQESFCERGKIAVEKKLRHLFNRDFYTNEGVLKTLQRMEKAWKFHKVKEIVVVEKRKKAFITAATSWTARSRVVNKCLSLTRSNNMRREDSDSLNTLSSSLAVYSWRTKTNNGTCAHVLQFSGAHVAGNTGEGRWDNT